jgi:CubicO group peptidase (beta-lactamase class C family)
MSPFGDDARSYYSPNRRRVALSVVASTTQVGTNFRYNNYHLLLEGLVLERATGMSVADYLEERIWQPMGAEFDAS